MSRVTFRNQPHFLAQKKAASSSRLSEQAIGEKWATAQCQTITSLVSKPTDMGDSAQGLLHAGAVTLSHGPPHTLHALTGNQSVHNLLG
jgi:hypothetical protein